MKRLDIGSTEEGFRRMSVDTLLANLPMAAECGAAAVGLLGGGDPGERLRPEGYAAFIESVSELSSEAARLGMEVIIEPLDRFAHKKGLVGPIKELLPHLESIRNRAPHVGICFDTAHVALNEEDFLKSIGSARNNIVQVHLANAVLDKNDGDYGDYHIAPGSPGFLTVESAAAILVDIARLCPRAGTGLRVAVEVRAMETDKDEQEMATIAKQFLSDVLEQAGAKLPPGESTNPFDAWKIILD